MKNSYYIEMPEAYCDLSDTLHRHFAPETPEECELVTSFVKDYWIYHQMLGFTTTYSYDPACPERNDLIEIATARLPVVQRRLVERFTRVLPMLQRRGPVAECPELALFTVPAAAPKIQAGEWVN